MTALTAGHEVAFSMDAEDEKLFIQAATTHKLAAVRANAADGLGYPGATQKALEALSTLARHDKSQLVRSRAILALGSTEDKTVVPFLLVLLSTELGKSYSDVIEHLLLALDKMGDPKAFDLVSRYLQSKRTKTPREVELAISILGKTRNENAVSIIKGFLNNHSHETNLEIHIAAIKALGELRFPSALQALDLAHARNHQNRPEILRAMADATFKIAFELKKTCEILMTNPPGVNQNSYQ